MDATIVFGIVGFIFQLFVLIGSTYAFVLKREAAMVAKMEQMHKEQDERIRENESEVRDIKDNYIRKFEKVYKVVGDVKLEIVNVIHEVETNLRESNHTLADNMTKAVNRLELIFMGKGKAQ